MRALVRHQYGGLEAARIEEIPDAVAGPEQILVRPKAVSLNALDAHALTGEPRFMRLGMGIGRPKDPQLGGDLAGVVEAVGPGLTGFAVGDEVFGQSIRTVAELVAVSREAIVPKPSSVSYEQAAATPVAAMTALQALRDKALVRAGQSVLIYGAAGGVGTFAVQLAKIMGAHVTAVCSTANVDLVTSLGADRVIDRLAGDPLDTQDRYDIVVDIAGYRSTTELLRVLRRGGRLALVGAGDQRSLPLVWRLLSSRQRRAPDGRTIMLVETKRTPADLRYLAQLLESGQLTPVIDLEVPFDRALEALAYVHDGHARGKAVITF